MEPDKRIRFGRSASAQELSRCTRPEHSHQPQAPSLSWPLTTDLRLLCPSRMAREMSEHRAIGSRHLAFGSVLNGLLAQATLLAGDWPDPTLRAGKDEQPPALHLVPGEPTRIHGLG